MNEIENNIIKASPTKDFFISMLVKDLTLRDAIGDLVDNSVDGARSLRTNNEYSELIINIEAQSNYFSIKDNCGGFSVETAREYAFRFGRPNDAPKLSGSIGRFGIGMKRALFKLGNKFTVRSKDATSEFEMEVDVDQWGAESEWDFKFKSFRENLDIEPESERGTEIIVTSLHKDVKEQFESPNFIKKLTNEIELENLYNIDRGLIIKVNDVKLKARHLDFINTDEIKTGVWQSIFDSGLEVKIYAGISEALLDDGGWYIFCNNRLVLGPEQTEITGWSGGRSSDGVAKYHHQFRRFRGYVFLNADDPSLLPWNTAKNGMDLDSPVFKSIRNQMIVMMRPVVTMLNKLKEEKENDNPLEDQKLNLLVDNSEPIPLAEIQSNENKYTANVFTFPTYASPRKQAPNENKITYFKSKNEVNKVKKSLGVNTLKEVGEKTFDYYFYMEVEE